MVDSGCDGNSNRFPSRRECENTCRVVQAAIREENIAGRQLATSPEEDISNFVPTEPLRPAHPADICTLPQVEGGCGGRYEAWSYDILDERCVPFIYTGCDGNENRFRTREECLDVCGGQKISRGFRRPVDAESTEKPTEFDRPHPQIVTYAPPTSILPELCRLPGEAGDCFGTDLHWYFNLESGKCDSFYYTGCKGNANRFSSEEACKRACGEYRDQNVCSLGSDEGPCDRTVNKWYFDEKDGLCELFLYGGCGGNGNRFSSKEECEKLCKAEIKSHSDICKLPQVVGPCRAAEERYFFNSASQQCESFVYGGCRGNQNNFPTKRDCSDRCSHSKQLTTEDICLFPRDSGPCTDAVSQWYFDRKIGQCKLFTYGGCRGNKNRFNTRHECETRCKGVKVASLAKNPQEVCFLKFDSGPCTAEFTKWYFDSGSGQCKEFVFSGCLGNANNFDTKQECEATCADLVPKKPSEPFRVVLVPSQRSYEQGDRIMFSCKPLVRELPKKGFLWYKDGQKLYSNDENKRIQIYLNGTMTIEQATPADTGEYTCAPDVNEESVFSDKIKITVSGGSEALRHRVSECVDMTGVANCKLIVRAGLCGHKYYGVFCCRSCQGAGVRVRRRRLR